MNAQTDACTDFGRPTEPLISVPNGMSLRELLALAGDGPLDLSLERVVIAADGDQVAPISAFNSALSD